MIILKGVPGLTTRETLQELIEISGDHVTTGYGGLVVDEKTAYEFLRTYLTMLGELGQPNPEPNPEPEPEEPQQEVAQVYVKPRTTRGRKPYDGSLH